MEEVSSRFSKDAGSEEIFIPEYECERPLGNIHQNTMDKDECGDDMHSPTRHIKMMPSQPMTATGKKQTITSLSSVSLPSDEGISFLIQY